MESAAGIMGMAKEKSAKRKLHTFGAFDVLLEKVRGSRIRSWDEIEREFIEIVERFDSDFASGGRSAGWYKAKARYFNDLIVALIENSCGKSMAIRCKRKSQLFLKIDIDICCPAEGDPAVAGEVKALGTPPHGGNQNKGREASKDLHKRSREVAFTSMDIKTAYTPARKLSSFQDWVNSSVPVYASFWAIRANGDSDLSRCRTILSSLHSYCNGVGAVIYTPTKQSQTLYEVQRYPELSIDRVVLDLSQRILSS